MPSPDPAGNGGTRPRSRPRDDGFTLLETLIAFAIASLFLTVMFQALATSRAASLDARMVEGAVSRARSHLAQAVATGQVGDRELVQSGTDGPDYRWRVVIRPIGRRELDRPGGMPGQPGIRTRWSLYRVQATVQWNEGTHLHTVGLATDRLDTSVPP